jgi:hypothetical protein
VTTASAMGISEEKKSTNGEMAFKSFQKYIRIPTLKI